MSKGAYSFLASLLALLLVSPIAGVNYSIVEQESRLLLNDNNDLARTSDYDVSIDFAESNQCPCEITRNGEYTGEFTVSNTGTFDDTYDLSVTWDDEYELGWDAVPNQETISLSAGTQGVVSFTYNAPVQGIYDGDSMDYIVRASSQNSSSVSDNRQQSLDVDMIYAVDIYVRDDTEKDANRGESVIYSIEVKNVGETTENFSIEVGDLPWDWTAETSISSAELDRDEYEIFTLRVDIPNTAAENEYAYIQVFARVQTSSYNHIYGFCNTNTTVNDGLTYAVDINPDALEKQVIPGGQVLYTLYVTNNGDSSDSYTLELGDVMEDGWGSNLSQFEINNLGPGEETAVVMNVTSPDDSEEDDSSLSAVTVTSKNRDQFDASVQMTTSVRIPIRDLMLSVDAEQKGGDPGNTVVYTVSLQNKGTDPDDFTLEIVRCDDCNAWGVELSHYQISDLEDGSVFEIEMHVEIPSSSENTESAEMGVVAYSTADNTVTDSITTLTTVNKVLNRQVTWSTDYIMNPGDSSTIVFSIINLGNSYQSYTFESDELPNGWTFTGLPYQTEDVEPYGGIETFDIGFTVANNENPGFFNFTVDVILDEDNFKVAEALVSIKIEHYADFIIDVLEIESFAGPGEMHTFNVEIINNANIEDDIGLEVTGLPEGWETCILFNNVCSSKVTVGKGQTSAFELQITTNQNEDANTVNGIFLHLEAVSGLNDKVSNFDTFTVYTNPVYDLLVEVPTDRKDGAPGESIPFQIVVTNEGNSIDYVNLPSPMAPAGWIASFSESSFTLEAMQSKTIYLNIDIPDNVYGGDNTIDAKVSSDQSGETIDLSFVVFVEEKANIDVEIKTTAGDVMAGTTGKFTVRITNTGNTIEKLSLTIEGKKRSWFTLPSDSISLDPGSYQEIVIEVDPPLTQAATESSATLNVTLSTDPSKSIKKALPFTVLKSDIVVDEPTTEEEDTLLPAPSFISAIVLLSLLSLIVRRR